ncbi:Mth938-like domain-containing protein [Meridianimarinicoccus aquatilis]|uniref:Mth938-like domain-containing protein n=1 Tax=Meridianimarinicoccus aquatilis TaxID=2552766 RepID=A0A4R6AS71_9RHOB|nr:Mth938-like domain-containing protein [Fluviibacterium aquatile]TDL86807.1 hypothetical protein E2L05_12865 [Fluviibacterium aquatile]
MRLNEVDYSDGAPIDGYGPGFFRVGGQVVTGGLLVAPGLTPAVWGGYDDAAPLLALSGSVDVLLVGTGAEIAHIPADLRAALEETGIGVEIMASPAACRTYNVLLSEGRRIGLAARPVA